MTLPLLVELPEMDARPELVVALLPKLESAESLPLMTLNRVAALLERAGHRGAFTRALVRNLVRGALAVRGDHHGRLWPVMATLVDLSPTAALRYFRASRERGVRTWADEGDPMRVEQAARAYEALHRPRRAAALYRMAARAGHPDRKELLARADALEKA
jgi:hypothetical protein